jgi:hypothetical protein
MVDQVAQVLTLGFHAHDADGERSDYRAGCNIADEFGAQPPTLRHDTSLVVISV